MPATSRQQWWRVRISVLPSVSSARRVSSGRACGSADHAAPVISIITRAAWSPRRSSHSHPLPSTPAHGRRPRFVLISQVTNGSIGSPSGFGDPRERVAGGRRRPSDGRKADGSAASSGWAESLGADGIRPVTELDEQFGRLLDERGRTADEDARPPAGRGSDRPEHLRVDPPRESAPVRGWIAGEREVDAKAGRPIRLGRVPRARRDTARHRASGPRGAVAPRPCSSWRRDGGASP